MYQQYKYTVVQSARGVIVHLHDFTYYYNVCLPLAYVD